MFQRAAGLLLLVTAVVGSVLIVAEPSRGAPTQGGQDAVGIGDRWVLTAEDYGPDVVAAPPPDSDDAPAGRPQAGGGPPPCARAQTWTFDPIGPTSPPTNAPSPEGHWEYLTCGEPNLPTDGRGWVWIGPGADGEDAPAPAVPDPAELAQQAFDELAPPAPQFDFRPRQHPGGPDATLVGLWTFFWADQGGLVPLNKRVAAGGNWAEVTATIRQVSFDPGDGSAPLSCPGGGTPYNPDLAYERQVTSCAHRYDRASPASGFTATATVTWSATWAGSGGTGGVLPDVTATATAVVPVQEMQVVND